MDQGFAHEPVLVEAALATWVTDHSGRYVDATIGGGGHAEVLLERFPKAVLLGLDRDPVALDAAARRLARFGDRVSFAQADFGELEAAVARRPGAPVVGVFGDLGVSSPQLDDPDRGFSYWVDGPLRLTLDARAARGAAEWLAEATEETVRKVLAELGELPGAARAARAIVRARRDAPVATTARLAAVLRDAGFGAPRRLSQAFQAIRFAVNDELGSLARGIDAAARILPEGGTLTLITFESLMDRIVKQRFAPPRVGRPIPGVPDAPTDWEPIHRKVVRPEPEETDRNPRARSARLRAARRLAHVAR